MNAVLADIFPYLVAFYVLDGLSDLRGGHILFSSDASGRFAVLRAGLHLVGLWPTSEVLSAQEWPLRANARGLHILDPGHRQSPAFVEAADLSLVPWEGLGDLTVEGRRLKAGGRTLLAAPSPATARLLGERLRALADAPQERRQGELERLLAEATDLDALRELRRRVATLRRWLATASALFFAGLFLGLPVFLFTEARRLSILPLLALLGVLHAVVVVLSALTLRRAGAGVRDLLGALAHLVLVPPSAAHALVHLLREPCARFDPRTLAAALLAPGDFKAYARRELARLARSRAGTASLGLERHWDGEERAWARLLERLEISAAEMMRPPARAGPESASYCPLCGGEYRAGYAVCAACGVPLRSFDDLQP